MRPGGPRGAGSGRTHAMERLIERGRPIPGSTTLLLPEGMREELKRPLGPVVDGEDLPAALPRSGPVATVGDMTTVTVHAQGVPISLAVVDYQTKRVPDPGWVEALAPVGDVVVEVDNPAASITAALYNQVLSAWSSQRPVKIVVRGEEDMASLPAILHAPEGATVIYGIPDTGLCLVQVDEGARDVVADVMRRLQVIPGAGPP